MKTEISGHFQSALWGRTPLFFRSKTVLEGTKSDAHVRGWHFGPLVLGFVTRRKDRATR